MNLDIRTLEVAVIIICSVFGPVSFAFGIGQPYAMTARLWGGALLALACGFALNDLDGHFPAFVSLFIAPTLLALALTLAQACARTARGVKGIDVPGWALFAGFALTILLLQNTANNPTLRPLLEFGLMGLMAFKAAYEFDQCKTLREGRPMRVIATMSGLLGAVLMVHAPGAGLPDESDTTAGLMRIGLMAGLLLSTVVLLWVMTERITRRLKDLADLDQMTGALNRQASMRDIEREISRSRRRTESRFAILLLDVDQFHLVNDTHGHNAGDKLLAAIVKTLRATIRNYDLVGRVGGNAFILILPGTWGENAANMAERAKNDIRQHAAKNLVKNPVLVSIGIAVYGENGDDLTTMMRSAEAALKLAKAAGGNRVEFALPVPSQRSQDPASERNQAAPPKPAVKS